MTHVRKVRVDVPTGLLHATPGALDRLDEDDMFNAFVQHATGYWGEVDEEDWKANDDALQFGGRLLSVFFDRNGNRFWIITEADRSVTTILLPEEY